MPLEDHHRRGLSIAIPWLGSLMSCIMPARANISGFLNERKRTLFIGWTDSSGKSTYQPREISSADCYIASLENNPFLISRFRNLRLQGPALRAGIERSVDRENRRLSIFSVLRTFALRRERESSRCFGRRCVKDFKGSRKKSTRSYACGCTIRAGIRGPICGRWWRAICGIMGCP